jgi:hypothetical protein
MAKKIKIKLENLTKDSTPCGICVAMNDREIETNKDGYYFDTDYCTQRFAGAVRGSGCTDVHKAQMRIEFLNYIEHRKPKEK